jgi:hypothetical protein
MVPTILVLIPAVLLPALGFLQRGLQGNLSTTLSLVGLAALLWAGPLWLILVAAVFRTGQRAFDARAGLGYAALAVVLTLFYGLGVFVVPLMVRADVQRLLDGSQQNSEQV